MFKTGLLIINRKWLGVFSLLQVVLTVIALYCLVNYFIVKYLSFSLPTPTCPQGANDTTLPSEILRKCSEERAVIYVSQWVLPVARWALAASGLCLVAGVGMVIVAWFAKPREPRVYERFFWLQVVIITSAVICQFLSPSIWIDLIKFVCTGNLFE